MTAARLVPSLLWPSDARLVLPGSKSEANRLLVAAALCGRTMTVHGATPSGDVQALVQGLHILGCPARLVDERTGRVEIAPRTHTAPSRGTIDCGNAGTALRFLVSVAAITPGDWTLTGDAAMQRRPIGPLVAAWRQLGVDASDHHGCPPVHVRCTHVPAGGSVTLAADQSSQFVSSLLLVGACLRDGLDITFAGELASAEYAHLTCRTLQRFGVTAHVHGTGASVRHGFAVTAPVLDVAADWSSAGLWTCLQHLTGSRVQAPELETGSGQADEQLAAALQAMPATGNHRLDVGAMPDQFLNLAIVAAHRDGETRLVGGHNLRVKECDRIAVMARELQKLGVHAHELPDGLVVRGGRPLRAATIDPEDDHRVAMAFALAGLLSPGLSIATPDCVTKSYPDFWRDLDTVVRDRRCVAVVGMRGAGKSTFARSLAAETGSDWIDTDLQFEARHGPIAPFVALHGWPAFRAHEEAITAEMLKPGRILSTGGGAVESASTRHLLRERTLVVWLDGDAALLRERVAASPTARPSLTGASPTEELEAIAARRRPLYADLATVHLPAALPTAQQIAAALAALGAPCRWPGTPGTP